MMCLAPRVNPNLLAGRTVQVIIIDLIEHSWD